MEQADAGPQPAVETPTVPTWRSAVTWAFRYRRAYLEVQADAYREFTGRETDPAPLDAEPLWLADREWLDDSPGVGPETTQAREIAATLVEQNLEALRLLREVVGLMPFGWVGTGSLAGERVHAAINALQTRIREEAGT